MNCKYSFIIPMLNGEKVIMIGDNKKENDVTKVVGIEDFESGNIIIQKGKKQFKKIILK